MEGMTIRPIRNQSDHELALAQIDALMCKDELSTEDLNHLEVMSILVEKYEETEFPLRMPTPVEAIEFRMDQEGLNRSDLAKKLGFSKSRISDVLNGKRDISLDMARALHEKMGVPADVLISKEHQGIPDAVDGIDWSKFPIREMVKNGWLNEPSNIKDKAEECVRSLMSQAGVSQPHFFGAAFRGTESKKPDPYCVNAWLFYVRGKAIACESTQTFCKQNIDAKFRRELAKLSLYSDGPARAFEELKRVGITPVVAKQLKKTHVDGACFKLPSGKPAIALSLRHDRLDNFWFTLLHECVHVERHLESLDFILDETEGQNGAFGNDSKNEHEANELARNALLPADTFALLKLHQNKMSKAQIVDLAKRADVHSAIVAGQFRVLTGRYTHFSSLLGRGIPSECLN